MKAPRKVYLLVYEVLLVVYEDYFQISSLSQSGYKLFCSLHSKEGLFEQVNVEGLAIPDNVMDHGICIGTRDRAGRFLSSLSALPCSSVEDAFRDALLDKGNFDGNRVSLILELRFPVNDNKVLDFKSAKVVSAVFLGPTQKTKGVIAEINFSKTPAELYISPAQADMLKEGGVS